MDKNIERKIIQEIYEMNDLRKDSFILFLLKLLPNDIQTEVIKMEIENSNFLNNACNSNSEELKELVFQAEYV